MQYWNKQQNVYIIYQYINLFYGFYSYYCLNPSNGLNSWYTDNGSILTSSSDKHDDNIFDMHELEIAFIGVSKYAHSLCFIVFKTGQVYPNP